MRLICCSKSNLVWGGHIDISFLAPALCTWTGFLHHDIADVPELHF